MKVRTRWAAVVELVTIAAIAAIVAIAAGCGGGDDDAQVASLSGNSRNASATQTTAKKQQDPAEAARDFARCMREHGVDMPDPKVDDQGRVQIQVGEPGGSGGGEGPSESQVKKMEAADRACRHFMEDAAPNGAKRLDPEQEAQVREQALAFAKCMREHGVDMPDPQFGSGGRVTQEFRKGNVSDRTFQAANKACMNQVGMKGGFVTAGPGGGATSSGKDGD
jgi:hypothetical protein